MRVQWSLRLARTLVVCACITALAPAGAFAVDDQKADEPVVDQKCSNYPATLGKRPAEYYRDCVGELDTPRDAKFSILAQRGPLLLQENATDTNNTSSVATIGVLTPFGPINNPADFPADIEILTTDSVYFYQLSVTGVVGKYDSNGVYTPIGTVAPPAGTSWNDLATDPTTGIVYAIASNGTTSTLHTMNLTAPSAALVGTITNSPLTIGLAATNSGALYGFDNVNNSLIAINKATGAGTIVGPLGFDPNFGQAMDCDPATGVCYLFDVNNVTLDTELRSVNLATGAATLVGLLPNPQVSQISSAVFGTIGACVTDADCADGNACNGVETCVATNCVAGTPVVCDDGDFCTIDSCVPASGACTTAPNPCADADPCTIDTCSGGACQHTGGSVQFCSGAAITIPTGPAAGTPYPSTINVSGLNTVGSVCAVSFRSLSHTFPDDIDVLVQGPTGPNALLMSDAGGGTDLVAIDLAFSDAAATSLPDGTVIATGTYKPTNFDTTTDVFPAPAPAPGPTSLAVFNGLNPNGAWRLFLRDDATGDGGTLGNWCISIVAPPCTNDASCSDNNACNGIETCNAGTCQTGTPISCDDGNPCTVDTCAPATGACSNVTNTCNDNDVCTRDYCDPVSGCHNDALTPTSFCAGPITIPSGPGNGVPYPSTVTVSGVSPQSLLCSVSFRGLSHTFPDDIDTLLVGPLANQNTRLISDVGGGTDVVNIDLTFKDAAAAGITDAGPMVTGIFKPSNVDTTDTFPAPAPPPNAVTALSNISGDPNGTWKLFLVDDATGDAGSLGTWCVNIVTGACGSNSECDDGNACNGSETCVATVCQPGTPISCDDSNPCTVDTCVPADGSCTYSATNCDDGDGCTSDSCDPSTGCGHVSHCVEFCNTGSVALTDGAAPPTMASPYPTTVNVSIPSYVGVPSVAQVKLNGITHTFPDDLDMLLVGPRDQNAIILSDVGGSADVTGVNLVLTDAAAAVVADGGPLVSGTFRPSNINPGTGTEAWPAPALVPSGGSALSAFTGVNPNGDWSLFIVDDQSTDSGAMAGGWCVSILVSCSTNTQCNDGNACTDDACVAGQCQNTTTSCDDGNACTEDACDEASGCVNAPITCDDGSACTSDSCDPASGCVYDPIGCDDSNACTADSCDPASGCVNAPVDADDGNACTADSCDPDTGTHYEPINCDDSNACTADSCDPASGCVNTPITCDDGSACTSDSCDAASGCVYTPITCDDGSACTSDSCDPASGCVYAPITCDDGDACTADSCDAATGCVYTEIPNCRCNAPEPNPHARGYWKRLCQGPHSGDELTADDASCVAGLGETFGDVSGVADICAVLNGSGNQCTQAEIELMSVALNICHQNVCPGTPISSQYGSNSSVGASYDQADGILSSGGDCLLAKGLGSEINTGRALHVDSVSFAKLTGGGARVNWTAMGGGTTPVVKYNVWRRQAGSLAPFAKIGETGSLSFDDTTPGNFEYEVTPVR